MRAYISVVNPLGYPGMSQTRQVCSTVMYKKLLVRSRSPPIVAGAADNAVLLRFRGVQQPQPPAQQRVRLPAYEDPDHARGRGAAASFVQGERVIFFFGTFQLLLIFQTNAWFRLPLQEYTTKNLVLCLPQENNSRETCVMVLLAARKPTLKHFWGVAS